MESKTKGILGIVSGVIAILMFPVIFGIAAIYYGYKTKNEGYEKLGKIAIYIGIISLVLAGFSFLINNNASFPILGFALDTSYPLRVMVSTSMFHDGDFDEWWDTQKEFYLESNITREQFNIFPQQNGFNQGDILIVKGPNPEKINIGDIIIFETKHLPAPIPHRVIRRYQENEINYFETKGDRNKDLLPHEKAIKEDQIKGKVIGKIPKIGWIKLFFINILNKKDRK